MNPCKIVYAAYRHDPTDPDASSGADYQFYHALQEQGAIVKIVGPFHSRPFIVEDLFRHLYRSLTATKYAKFPLSLAWSVSHQVNRAVRRYQPDLVFSLFPPALTFYTEKTPCIYRQDTSFWGWQNQYAEFGRLGYAMSIWSEKRVFARASKIITHSKWNHDILVREYGLSSQNILVMPNPGALPSAVISGGQAAWQAKEVLCPVRLLFVGRDSGRKGEDIAIETVRLLNASGTPAHLTVCGLPNNALAPYTTYVGTFRKSVPAELQQYADLFKKSHFLLHPARFDPSPIVTAEAAAFGTPTITNNVGGLATSVADGTSGVVLPPNSPAELYAQTIIALVNHPARYQQLRQSTRQRYERELNWDVVGPKLMATIHEVVQEYKRHK